MKKLNIFLATALAAGLVACEDSSDKGIPQVTPQLPIVTANGVTVAWNPALSAIDLNDYVVDDVLENTPISIVDLAQQAVDNEKANLPEGTTLSYEVSLAKTDDFAGAETIPVVGDAIGAQELQQAMLNLYDIDPSTQSVWLGLAVYANIYNSTSGLTQTSRLGGEGFHYLVKNIRVTPVDAALDIEDAYYIMGSDIAATPGSAVAMFHGPQHPYLDPEFSYTFEVTDAQAAAGFTWMIVPASVHDANGTVAECYGPAGTGADDALEGTLANDGVYGVIKTAGNYVITVNMLELKYSVMLLLDNLYYAGNANGWSLNEGIALTSYDKGNSHIGFIYINGEYKFAGQAGDWNPLNWGAGASEGTLAAGAGNLQLPADGAGVYYAVVKIPTLTYELTKINAVCLVGSYNGWDGAAGTALTQDATNPYIWSGDVALDGGAWKFNMNNDSNWTINLGGNPSALTFGGGNLNEGETAGLTPTAGTYHVTLNLQYPQTCTVEAL